MIPRIMSAAIDMDSVMNNGMSLPERLGLGLETMLIGLGTVFGVLIIIMAILYLFQFLFYTLPNRKKNASSTKETAAVTETAVDETAHVNKVISDAEGDEGELIAAISAAVAVYLDQPASSFRVVSFKRINKNK